MQFILIRIIRSGNDLSCGNKHSIKPHQQDESIDRLTALNTCSSGAKKGLVVYKRLAEAQIWLIVT